MKTKMAAIVALMLCLLGWGIFTNDNTITTKPAHAKPSPKATVPVREEGPAINKPRPKAPPRVQYQQNTQVAQNNPPPVKVMVDAGSGNTATAELSPVDFQVSREFLQRAALKATYEWKGKPLGWQVTFQKAEDQQQFGWLAHAVSAALNNNHGYVKEGKPVLTGTDDQLAADVARQGWVARQGTISMRQRFENFTNGVGGDFSRFMQRVQHLVPKVDLDPVWLRIRSVENAIETVKDGIWWHTIWIVAILIWLAGLTIRQSQSQNWSRRWVTGLCKRTGLETPSEEDERHEKERAAREEAERRKREAEKAAEEARKKAAAAAAKAAAGAAGGTTPPPPATGTGGP